MFKDWNIAWPLSVDVIQLLLTIRWFSRIPNEESRVFAKQPDGFGVDGPGVVVLERPWTSMYFLWGPVQSFSAWVFLSRCHAQCVDQDLAAVLYGYKCRKNHTSMPTSSTSTSLTSSTSRSDFDVGV